MVLFLLLHFKGPRRSKVEAEPESPAASAPAAAVHGAFGSGPRRTKEVKGAFGSGE